MENNKDYLVLNAVVVSGYHSAYIILKDETNTELMFESVCFDRKKQ